MKKENDICNILDTIVKTKHVFDVTAGEIENLKNKVKKMDQKMGKMEDILAESAEMMKTMINITIVLAIICLFLISVICLSPYPHDADIGRPKSIITERTVSLQNNTFKTNWNS